MNDYMNFFNEWLPDWAIGHSDGGYLVEGTQLATRDGRRMGNAVVVSVLSDERARVLTDMGNELIMTLNEMEEAFHKPKYVMDVKEAIERRVHADTVEAT